MCVKSINFYSSSKYPLGTPVDEAEVKLHLNKTVLEFVATFTNTTCTNKHTKRNHKWPPFKQWSPYKSAECVFDADTGKTFHTSNLSQSHKKFNVFIQ